MRTDLDRLGTTPEALRRTRESLTLTVGEVADALGMKALDLAAWEEGLATPSTVEWQRLAKFYYDLARERGGC